MMKARKLFRPRPWRWPPSLAASTPPFPLHLRIISQSSPPAFPFSSLFSPDHIDPDRLRRLLIRRFSSDPDPTLIDVPLAQTGEGIAECELLKWFVREEDDVEEFQPLCQVQSDKATIDITSRYKGKISKLLHVPGDIIKVGETLVKLYVHDKQPTTDSPNLSTPSVRHLAKQHSVDLGSISGTGKGGRITKEDILNHKKNPPQKQEETTIPLRGYQKAMAAAMTSAAKVPHFYYVEEMNCTALTNLKSSIQQSISDPSLKCTFLPILIKSLSESLKAFPFMNSTFIEDSVGVSLKHHHNVGVAMATAKGLVVPNIKNVESLSIMEIIKELSRLQMLAKENNLTHEDVNNGTITLSNIGAIGGTLGMPLVNVPESAIIALGRIKRVPAFDELGNVVASSVINVTVGADHRAIDGAMVASFCNHWKRTVQCPEILLMNMR